MLVVEDLAPRGLAPVNFRLGDKECITLSGPSGSGKTVLLRAIADLDPVPGRRILDGAECRSMPAPLWRRRVCYIAAEPGWWAEKVAAHFGDWTQALPMVRALMLRDGIGDEPVARLSTGERQRLALVRALVQAPKVLLLDEPTAALDASAREAAERMLADARDRGASLVWVTHDPEQALRVASRHLVIRDGHVIEEERGP